MVHLHSRTEGVEAQKEMNFNKNTISLIWSRYSLNIVNKKRFRNENRNKTAKRDADVKWLPHRELVAHQHRQMSTIRAMCVLVCRPSRECARASGSVFEFPNADKVDAGSFSCLLWKLNEKTTFHTHTHTLEEKKTQLHRGSDRERYQITTTAPSASTTIK